MEQTPTKARELYRYARCVALFKTLCTPNFKKKWFHYQKKPCDICGKYFYIGGWKYGKEKDVRYRFTKGYRFYKNYGYLCGKCGCRYEVAFCLINLLSCHDDLGRPKKPYLKGYYDE